MRDRDLAAGIFSVTVCSWMVSQWAMSEYATPTELWGEAVVEAALAAQAILLTAWAGIADIRFLVRCGILALCAFALNMTSDWSQLHQPLVIASAILRVTVISATGLVLRTRGMRLRKAQSARTAGPLRFKLASLFVLLTVSAVLMMMGNAIYLSLDESEQLAITGYESLLGIEAGLIVALACAVLGVRRPLFRSVAVSLAIAVVVAVDQRLIRSNDTFLMYLTTGEVALFALFRSLEPLFILLGLLIVRARGYRLGWFEPSPQERIAAGRAELQALVDAHAAAKAASHAET